MSAISQSSLRALGCLRLRSRTRPGSQITSKPRDASSRRYAQLAPKVEDEEYTNDDIGDAIEDGPSNMRTREIYGREFVKRHLQELDRARAAEPVAVKQKLGE